jgi:hypothetical protein
VTPSEKPQTPDLSNSLEGLVFFGMSKTIVPVNLFPGLVSSKKVLESSNRFEGREAVRDFITTFHTQLFDAHSEVKSLAIGDGIEHQPGACVITRLSTHLKRAVYVAFVAGATMLCV